jgi:hypothetical protein
VTFSFAPKTGSYGADADDVVVNLEETTSVLARHQLPGETGENILQETRREAAKAT